MSSKPASLSAYCQNESKIITNLDWEIFISTRLIYSKDFTQDVELCVISQKKNSILYIYL